MSAFVWTLRIFEVLEAVLDSPPHTTSFILPLQDESDVGVGRVQ